MMDFNVVVFPAPLRPIRQTISPLATSIVTSCSTWLESYQALRFSTCSIRSVLPLAKIDPLHRFVLTNLRRRSLGKQFSVMQHQDTVADAQHQFHLVFDQNDGAFGGELDDQIHHHSSLFRTHAGGRLVE